MSIRETLDDKKVKLTILIIAIILSFLTCMIYAIPAAVYVHKGQIGMAIATGFMPALVWGGMGMLGAWIILRDFHLKSSKRIKPATFYKVVTGLMITVVVITLVCGLML